MTIPTRALIALLSGLSLLSALAAPAISASIQRSEAPVIAAVRVQRPPVIDGRFEANWLAAPAASGFVEVEPYEGRPASERTRVHLLYDDEALYVAFFCLDSAPDSIRGQLQRRDRSSYSDAVSIGIDSFHDNRNGYNFTVTAAGVQRDFITYRESAQDDSWEGVWESAVALHDSGWVAEMRLPFASFRHGGDRPDGWGVNFIRVLERRDAWFSWVPLDRNEGNRVSRWGVLTGLAGIPDGLTAQLLPHVVASAEQASGGVWNSGTSFDGLGLDAKLIPSPSWTIDLTLQPDFAQVEVDDEVINLDPYPVYLEERRPFFLEGLSLFESLPLNLFYTRKITDPDLGVKLTGSNGRLRSSVLAARNHAEGGTVQAAGAGRAVLNFGQTSTVGATGTMLVDDSLAVGVGGLDGRLRFGRLNSLTWLVAAVEKDGLRRQPVATRVNLFLSNGPWRGETNIRYLGRDFDVNDLGFTRYSNVLAHSVWLQRRIFPAGGAVRAVYANTNAYQEAMPDGDLYERSVNAGINVQLRSNWWFGGNANWGSGFFRYRPDEGENLTSAPKYTDNFGRFEPRWQVWYNRRLYLDSDSREPFSWELSAKQGTFREGLSWGGSVELKLRPLSNIELESEIDWTRIDNASEVNNGALTDFRIARFSGRYSPTLQISLRATMQYVLEEEQLLTNLLAAWQWAPGSWLYLVYDESRSSNFQFGWNPTREPAWGHGDRSLRLKATWYLALP